MDLSDDTDPEEDDEWWLKEFGEVRSGEAPDNDEDDPVLQKLANDAAAMAEDPKQKFDEDEQSLGSLGEASLGSLEGGEGEDKDKDKTGAMKANIKEQESPDSVKDMIQASQEAGKGLLTEENLADPSRKLRSPGPPPNRKTLAPGASINGASPTNDDSSQAEEEAGTDVEGGDSDGWVGPPAASPLMPMQELGPENGQEQEQEYEQGMKSKWRVAQLDKTRAISVFNVSTVTGSLEDMTFSVDAAFGPDGEADPKDLYRGLARDADLLSLGGALYEGTDLLYDPLSGATANPDAGVEVEENDFDDEGEDPRALLLGNGDSTEATNLADPSGGYWEESANNSGLPTEQQLMDGLVDVTEEEMQRLEQEQIQQQKEEDRASESNSSHLTKESATDDALLGSRKRDKKSKRAKPPSVDDESKEEGAEKYKLLSGEGLSPSKLSQGSGGEEGSLDSKFDPDALVFGKVRHYHVHRESEKQVEGAKKSESGVEDLGHVILRLLPSNRGNVIAGLDEGVRHMSLGETANIKIRFDHAYSSFAMTEYIPARANMVFTVKLKAINGFGLAGLPLRVVKRLYRFTTFACRKTGDFMRHVYRDMKKKKRMRRLCSYLYSFIKKPPPEEFSDDGDDEVMEYEEEEEEESDEEDVRPLNIKADASMRKHLTPAVHAGAKYFWNYKPQLRAKKSKKNKKQENKEQEEDREGDSDDTRSEIDEDVLEDIEEGEYEGQEEGMEPQSEHDDANPPADAPGEATNDGREQDPTAEAEMEELAAPPEESIYKGIKNKPPPEARSGRRPAPPKE